MNCFSLLFTDDYLLLDVGVDEMITGPGFGRGREESPSSAGQDGR
jgi:hypothetical protein